MKWLSYLLEVNVYMVLFYSAYYLLLRRETHYQLNRVYLLASSLLAFVIPLLQVGILKHPTLQPLSALSQNVMVVTNPSVNPLLPTEQLKGWAPADYCLLMYLVIAVVLTLLFIVKIYQLIKLSHKGTVVKKGTTHIIELDDDDHAFSFFSYLFISKKLSLSTTIIQHELVHIRQKHSLDIIYIELLKIICWFNPVIYLMQSSIKELHEYIADRQMASEPDIINTYTDFLIGNAYGLPETALVNNFFNKNLLKNRITMLHQKRSGSLARLKYLVALPLLAGMLCLSTLGFSKDYATIDLAPRKIKTNATAKVHVANRISAVKPNTITYTIDPLSYNEHSLKIISDQLYKQGFIMKFKDLKKSDLLDLSLETKPEMPWHSMADATFRVPQLTKSGYMIIIGADLTSQHVFVHSEKKSTNHQNEINRKTMPATLSKVAQDNPVTDTGRAAFTDLYKQLMRNIRYPADAWTNNIQGKVFVAFTVDANDKVDQASILRGLYDSQDKEVIRALKACVLPSIMKPGITYTIPVSFTIQGSADGQPYINKNPKYHIKLPAGNKLYSLNEVVIIGYKTVK